MDAAVDSIRDDVSSVIKSDSVLIYGWISLNVLIRLLLITVVSVAALAIVSQIAQMRTVSQATTDAVSDISGSVAIMAAGLAMFEVDYPTVSHLRYIRGCIDQNRISMDTLDSSSLQYISLISKVMYDNTFVALKGFTIVSTNHAYVHVMLMNDTSSNQHGYVFVRGSTASPSSCSVRYDLIYDPNKNTNNIPTLQNPTLGWCQYNPWTDHPALTSVTNPALYFRPDKYYRSDPYGSRSLSGSLSLTKDILGYISPVYSGLSGVTYYMREPLRRNNTEYYKKAVFSGVIIMERSRKHYESVVINALPKSFFDSGGIFVIVNRESAIILASLLSDESIIGLDGSKVNNEMIKVGVSYFISYVNKREGLVTCDHFRSNGYLVECQNSNGDLSGVFRPITAYDHIKLSSFWDVFKSLETATVLVIPDGAGSSDAGIIGLIIVGSIFSILLIIYVGFSRLPLFEKRDGRILMLSENNSNAVQRMTLSFILLVLLLVVAWLLWSTILRSNVNIRIDEINVNIANMVEAGFIAFTNPSLLSTNALIQFGSSELFGFDINKPYVVGSMDRFMCDIIQAYASETGGLYWTDSTGHFVGCQSTSMTDFQGTKLLAADGSSTLLDLTVERCLSVFDLDIGKKGEMNVFVRPGFDPRNPGLCPFDPHALSDYRLASSSAPNTVSFGSLTTQTLFSPSGKPFTIVYIPVVRSYNSGVSNTFVGAASSQFPSFLFSMILRNLCQSFVWGAGLLEFHTSSDVKSPLAVSTYDHRKLLKATSLISDDFSPFVENSLVDKEGNAVPIEDYENKAMKASIEILERNRIDLVSFEGKSVTLFEHLLISARKLQYSSYFVSEMSTAIFTNRLDSANSQIFIIVVILIACIIGIATIFHYIVSSFTAKINESAKADSDGNVNITASKSAISLICKGECESKTLRTAKEIKLLMSLIRDDQSSISSCHSGCCQIWNALGDVSAEDAIESLEHNERDAVYDPVCHIVFKKMYSQSFPLIYHLRVLNYSTLLLWCRILVLTCYAAVLIWFEPIRFSDSNKSAAVVACEAVCVFLLVFDYVATLTFVFFESKLWSLTFQTLSLHVCRGMLLFIFLWDLCVDFASISGDNISMIRVARPFRLLYAVFMLEFLYKRLIIIVRAFVDLGSVVVFMMSMIIISTALGLALYAFILTGEAYIPFPYKNFLIGFWTTLVLTTAENFPHLVGMAVEIGWSYSIYFIIVAVVAMVFVDALVIQTFGNSYSDWLDYLSKKNRRRRWRAMSAVFYTLDVDSTATLSVSEIRNFLKQIWSRDRFLGGVGHENVLDDVMKEVLLQVDVSGKRELDIESFESLYTMIRYLEVMNPHDFNNQKQTTWVYRLHFVFSRFLPIKQICVGAIYGTVDSSSVVYLDRVLLVCIPSYWFLDICSLFICYFWKSTLGIGWRAWIRSLVGRSNGIVFFCDMIDRVTLLLGTVGWIWCMSSSLSQDDMSRLRHDYYDIPLINPNYSIVGNSNIKRFLLLIPICRVFTSFNTLKRWTYLLSVVALKSLELLYIMVSMYYIYVMFGCQFLSDKIVGETLTFKTLFEGSLLLLQVFLGPNWYEAAGRSITNTNPSMMLFWITYVFLFSQLFADLYKGAIIDRANELQTLTASEASDTNAIGYFVQLFDIFTEEERLELEERAQIIRMNIRRRWIVQMIARDCHGRQETEDFLTASTSDALFEIARFEKHIKDDLLETEEEVDRLKTHIDTLRRRKTIILSRVRQASMAFSSSPSNNSQWAANKFRLNAAKSSGKKKIEAFHKSKSSYSNDSQ